MLRDRTSRAGRSGSAGRLLEVQDCGAGIPEDVLARVFDPFFTTKPEGQGVGLGLAVVYGIVDAHGGTIELRSKPGEGTTARVVLPLSVAEPGCRDPPAAHRPARTGVME